ncbi:GspH/FimT family pseudopilin [Ectothiorhodospiraceae bacterium 2226]|nr:GspH/FimT family pseudopilin [Ectothiorhodospiraceae bacterium 2226]
MTRPTRTGGFTLVELMVALAVLGILAAIAAPSLGTFVVNQRVKTEAANLFADLNYARAEAIKRNGRVWVRPNDGNWENGWVIVADGATSYDSCRTTPNNTDCVRLKSAIEGLSITGPDLLIYERSGRLSTTGATIELCNTTGGAFQRTIRIDLSGRPNLALGDNCEASS